jgi:hypothetical protein
LLTFDLKLPNCVANLVLLPQEGKEGDDRAKEEASRDVVEGPVDGGAKDDVVRAETSKA